jgi:periplasmic protein TonB
MRSKHPGPLLVLIAALLVCVGSSSTAKDKSKNGVTAPKPIYTPDPEYTPAARRDRVQGVAVVRLNLDAEGVPHDIKIVRSLRSDLDPKAIEAVAKWRFRPAMKDGSPIPMQLTVEVSFRLY